MQMKDIINRLDNEKRGEMLRFIIVGIAAVGIQYGVYLVLIKWLSPTLSNTIAYVVSFCFNYFASTRFTFRVRSTAQRGVGFAFSHLINYLLQSLLLVLFLRIGISKPLAMLPVFGICVPINFILVRFFLKKH